MTAKIIVATIAAAPEHAATVMQALEEAVRAVREEPGCEQYDLHRDTNDPNRFVMIERWSDAGALAQHANAPAFRKLASTLEGRATLEVSHLVRIA
ncbi:putative quinol monooxygenase [Paraburkholderia youngii]|uniref:Antibiotic biosynthesis monooxygenase n=1 Tax=Paraburkholderia youngii TaxID=2782701 RepID=A0A7Y6JZ78_9BURK|nr:putative quinol monooxygenase [Paraburkholderia youngii]NUY01466.1 antibiotic biosynthesis monooxygenase [Paraburkholderia youngii]